MKQMSFGCLQKSVWASFEDPEPFLEDLVEWTEGEFMAFVETAQGLLGVDFSTVEENTVTQEGLKAIGRLIRTKNLGIETQEGRRIWISVLKKDLAVETN